MPEVDIYGYGFDDFYCTNSNIENLQIENKNKLNILIIHGTLNGASIEEKQYNSMSKNILDEKQFDYIALGHIHKANYNEQKNIIYPGSMTSLGFDELGKHGMIVGELKDNNLQLDFIPVDDEEFIEIELDATEISSKEDLIEKINQLEIQDNQYVKIILTGKRNFEINKYELLKCVINNKIIKIKDKTKIAYNLEAMANENTLKGLFVKQMLERLNQDISEEQKEIVEKAIEIGLESLE